MEIRWHDHHTRNLFVWVSMEHHAAVHYSIQVVQPGISALNEINMEEDGLIQSSLLPQHSFLAADK